jgi:hypothetical protein
MKASFVIEGTVSQRPGRRHGPWSSEEAMGVCDPALSFATVVKSALLSRVALYPVG